MKTWIIIFLLGLMFLPSVFSVGIHFWNFEEGSGVIAIDQNVTLNQSNGSVVGAVYSSNHYLGDESYSLFFDGIDDYVNLTKSFNLNHTNNISVVAWINPSSYNSSVGMNSIIFRHGQNQAEVIGFRLDAVTGTLLWSVGHHTDGTFTSFLGNITIPLNSWSFVGASFNGNDGNLSIFFNGSLDNSTIMSGGLTKFNNSVCEVAIGNNLGVVCLGRTQNETFNGSMDHVKVFDYVLSPSDFSDLYDVGNSSPVLNVNVSVPSPLELGRNGFLSLNVTDPEGDVVTYCNFSVVSPNGTVLLDNVGGVNYLVDLWNSSVFEAINLGGYFWSVNCSDGVNVGSYDDYSFLIVDNVSFDEFGVNPEIFAMNQNVSVFVNFSTDFNGVGWVNWTVWRGAEIYVDNVNSSTLINTSYRDWVSNSSVAVNSTGVYEVNITVEVNGSVYLQYFNFSVNDTLTISPSSWVRSINTKGLEYLFQVAVCFDESSSFDFTFNHSEPLNNSFFNVSFLNTSNDGLVLDFFNVSGVSGSCNPYNPFLLNVSVNNWNVSVLDDTYLGNITIVRGYDGDVTVIPLTVGVHPPAGVLTELVYSTLATCDNSNCDLDVAFDTGTSFSSNLLLNNTGDHKLYNCTPKIVGSDFSGVSWYSFNTTLFDLSLGETKSLSLDFVSADAGLYVGYFDVVCNKSNSFGDPTSLGVSYPDLADVLVEVTTPATSGGGGGGGGGDTTVIIQNVTLPVGFNVSFFSVRTVNKGRFYDWNLVPNSSREGFVVVSNLQENNDLLIDLSCVSTQPDVCDWVVFEKTNFFLVPKSGERVGFVLNVPDVPFGGIYSFSIVGNALNLTDRVTVNVAVNSLGYLFILPKLIVDKVIGSFFIFGVEIPSFILFLTIPILTIIIFWNVFKKDKNIAIGLSLLSILVEWIVLLVVL